MWHRVDIVWTDVSEERIASILMVEKSASEEPAWAGGCSILHSHRCENLKSYNILSVDQNIRRHFLNRRSTATQQPACVPLLEPDESSPHPFQYYCALYAWVS
jgi:hypothetical protein